MFVVVDFIVFGIGVVCFGIKVSGVLVIKVFGVRFIMEQIAEQVEG